MVRSWLGALGPTHGDWLTRVRWSAWRAAAAAGAGRRRGGCRQEQTEDTAATAAGRRVHPPAVTVGTESGAHVSGVRSPPRAGAMLASVRSTSASQPRPAEPRTRASRDSAPTPGGPV